MPQGRFKNEGKMKDKNEKLKATLLLRSLPSPERENKASRNEGFLPFPKGELKTKGQMPKSRVSPKSTWEKTSTLC
jgi:hypothetical protein